MRIEREWSLSSRLLQEPVLVDKHVGDGDVNASRVAAFSQAILGIKWGSPLAQPVKGISEAAARHVFVRLSVAAVLSIFLQLAVGTEGRASSSLGARGGRCACLGE